MTVGNRKISAFFELNRTDFQGTIRAMEGMRGLAVFLVFLVHYTSIFLPMVAPDPVWKPVAEIMGQLGNVGVDLFFLLSGYLIYGSLLSKEKPFFSYMKRRVLRIYPTFFVVFLAYLVLSFAFPSTNKIPHGTDGFLYILANFFLVPDLVPQQPLITVAWSLSYEMSFYLVLPLFVRLLKFRTRAPLWRLRALVAIASLLWVAQALWGGPVRMIMFFAGMILFETIKTKPHAEPSTLLTSFLLAAAAVFALVTWLGVPEVSTWAGPLSLAPWVGAGADASRVLALFLSFYAMAFVSFGSPVRGFGRFFGRTPLRWLGNMSYSYYLIHGLTLKGLAMLLARWVPAGQILPTGFFWLAMIPFLGVTVLVATALFGLVERPFSLRPSASAKTLPHREFDLVADTNAEGVAQPCGD